MWVRIWKGVDYRDALAGVLTEITAGLGRVIVTTK